MHTMKRVKKAAAMTTSWVVKEGLPEEVTVKQRPDWSRANSGKVWGRVFWAEGTENAKPWEGNQLGVAKEQKEPTEAEA